MKLLAEDGKMRMTDVADTEQLFRLIQSVPSPKAEPFKQWLAQVGRERIDELEDPEIGILQLPPCGTSFAFTKSILVYLIFPITYYEMVLRLERFKNGKW